MLAAFALLALNLLHPGTLLNAGLAQFVFQISIGAPLFWMAATFRSPGRFARLLWIVLVVSAASAAVGVLQVYYPERFLPPAFSELGTRLNPTFVSNLSYIGPDGRPIVRPPGLTDLPGGAGVAGLLTVVLGIAYISQEKSGKLLRMCAIAAVAVGMTALYLTQIRSLTVTAMAGVLVLVGIHMRQGRIMRGGWIAGLSLVVMIGSFLWAGDIGGDAVRVRFSGLVETGLFRSYAESRGLFVDYTVRDLLFRFPFGAGLGRWGMMPVYFSDWTTGTTTFGAEIQLTGWLLDGGVLLCLFYGGALVTSWARSYVSAIYGSTIDEQYLGSVVLALQSAIIGLCFTAPVFNTELGMIFWMATGGLYGATCAKRVRDTQRRDSYSVNDYGAIIAARGCADGLVSGQQASPAETSQVVGKFFAGAVSRVDRNVGYMAALLRSFIGAIDLGDR
jgi:hypothetical protein